MPSNLEKRAFALVMHTRFTWDCMVSNYINAKLSPRWGRCIQRQFFPSYRHIPIDALAGKNSDGTHGREAHHAPSHLPSGAVLDSNQDCRKLLERVFPHHVGKRYFQRKNSVQFHLFAWSAELERTCRPPPLLTTSSPLEPTSE